MLWPNRNHHVAEIMSVIMINHLCNFCTILYYSMSSIFPVLIPKKLQLGGLVCSCISATFLSQEARRRSSEGSFSFEGR